MYDMGKANEVWLTTLQRTMEFGHTIGPRGMSTKEVLGHTLVMDMHYPIVTSFIRRLNYRFMFAEAYWIITGDNRVETIEPYNKHIAQFSDDGEVFAGAYGPPISEQIGYVCGALDEDPHTRQAGLTIWRPNPEPSKDIPCTIAVWFMQREARLHTHVFMRSSDVWLGVPYDIFNFSMLTWYVCGLMNEADDHRHLEPGFLYLTAFSRHLYERDQMAAVNVLGNQEYERDFSRPLPGHLAFDGLHLLNFLISVRDWKAPIPTTTDLENLLW